MEGPYLANYVDPNLKPKAEATALPTLDAEVWLPTGGAVAIRTSGASGYAVRMDLSGLSVHLSMEQALRLKAHFESVL